MVILKNRNGIEAGISNYGARLVYLLLDDKQGITRDLVAGFENLDGYLQSTETFYGCCVGRYANRIKEGKFILDGKAYQLPVNNAPNHLHGGLDGFHNQVWGMQQVSENKVILKYSSADMEEGYPGKLIVTLTYTLTDENCFSIQYEAGTDTPTIINLTHHAFFNLNGLNAGNILNHKLWINADKYTPVDSTAIPLGNLEEVTNGPFDFRKSKTIGQDIGRENIQLSIGHGYDHNFVLNGKEKELKHAAQAIGDSSNIKMDVYTTEPGMQLYTGNFLKGENMMKAGIRDEFQTAFCLETQHFPNSINQPSFPSCVLRPGEIYYSETTYCFTV